MNSIFMLSFAAFIMAAVLRHKDEGYWIVYYCAGVILAVFGGVK